VRAAWASFLCISLVLLLLAAHGASDWSTGFAVLWNGLWAAALVLAFAAIAAAVFGSSMSARDRRVAAGVSGVTVAVTGVLVCRFLHVLSHVS
jgi:hypothetical protein